MKLWQHPATQLAALIAQVSCRDALEAHLHRVDAINGLLNAVTVIFDQAALAHADRLARRLQQRLDAGPLARVPFHHQRKRGPLGPSHHPGLTQGGRKHCGR